MKVGPSSCSAADNRSPGCPATWRREISFAILTIGRATPMRSSGNSASCRAKVLAMPMRRARLAMDLIMASDAPRGVDCRNSAGHVLDGDALEAGILNPFTQGVLVRKFADALRKILIGFRIASDPGTELR